MNECRGGLSWVLHEARGKISPVFFTAFAGSMGGYHPVLQRKHPPFSFWDLFSRENIPNLEEVSEGLGVGPVETGTVC